MASTGVFWAAGREEFVPYNSEEHRVCKFLCWGDENKLVVVAGGMHWDHDTLAGAAEEAGLVGDARPIAAGICSFVERGVVRTWDSGVLRVSTPSQLRPIILQALGLR